MARLEALEAVLGLALIVAGVACFSLGAALIVAGAGILAPLVAPIVLRGRGR